MITNNCEAVEYELLKLGQDIYDLEDGPLTIRRAWNIVRRVGPESELAAERSNLSPEQRLWRPEMWGIAHLIDLTQQHIYYFSQANGGKPQEPKPYPRPTDTAPASAKPKKKKPGSGLSSIRTVYTPK